MTIEEEIEHMETTLLLCDFAQAVGGKLYILGGGWTICTSGPTNLALAIKVLVPWSMATEKHKLKLTLADGNGKPIAIGEPPTQIMSEGEFEVGIPPGTPKGTPLDFAIAINFLGLPLIPETKYRWQLEINGEAIAGVSFRTLK